MTKPRTKSEGHQINTTTLPHYLKLAELDSDPWLDSDDPLTDQEKALLEARLAEIEKHPEKSIPWDEAKKRLDARFGK